MWIVAACTVKFLFRVQWILGAFQRMSADRMAFCYTCQLIMATGTEFVDRFIKHILIFRGMGIMAGDTAPSLDDAMDINTLGVLLQQIFLVNVATDA